MTDDGANFVEEIDSLENLLARSVENIGEDILLFAENFEQLSSDIEKKEAHIKLVHKLTRIRDELIRKKQDGLSVRLFENVNKAYIKIIQESPVKSLATIKAIEEFGLRSRELPADNLSFLRFPKHLFIQNAEGDVKKVASSLKSILATFENSLLTNGYKSALLNRYIDTVTNRPNQPEEQSIFNSEKSEEFLGALSTFYKDALGSEPISLEVVKDQSRATVIILEAFENATKGFIDINFHEKCYLADLVTLQATYSSDDLIQTADKKDPHIARVQRLVSQTTKGYKHDEIHYSEKKLINCLNDDLLVNVFSTMADNPEQYPIETLKYVMDCMKEKMKFSTFYFDQDDEGNSPLSFAKLASIQMGLASEEDLREVESYALGTILKMTGANNTVSFLVDLIAQCKDEDLKMKLSAMQKAFEDNKFTVYGAAFGLTKLDKIYNTSRENYDDLFKKSVSDNIERSLEVVV